MNNLSLYTLKRSLGVILGFFFFSACSNLFYHPTSTVYRIPTDFKLQYQSFDFSSKDGTKLHGWKIPRRDLSKKSLGTILFFHGNAQNLSAHFMQIVWIVQMGYDLMIFDYRGYGQSAGSPSQDGIYEDGMAALKIGYEWSQENKAPFIVYGQSLGGNISMRCISDFPDKEKIKLLILDSTFMSYQKMAWDKMTSIWLFIPFSPLSFVFFSDRYAAELTMDKLPNIPTLLLHGTKDEVVPFKFGEKIFERLKQPKWFWRVENGMHTDAYFRNDHNYREDLIEFISKLAFQNAWYQ